VIHEALTGRPVFDGDSSMDVLFKHASEPPPRMSQARSDLPADLDAPVLAMLAKDPNQRPATAGEAVAELALRAKEHVHAETLPVSSDVPREPAPRLGTDDPTVAVRQRKTPGSKPDPVVAAKASESQIETEIATAETMAVPSVVGKDSTEPAAPQETLRSPGPLEAATEQASPKAAPKAARSDRGAGLWVGIGGLAIAVIVAGVAFARSGGGAPTTGISQPPATSTNTSPQAEMVSVRVKVAPADAWLVIGDRRSRASDPLILPRSSQSQALRVERDGYEPETVWVVPDRDTELSPIALTHAAPIVSAAPSTGASIPPGKGIAKPKLHDDLERPPELDPPR